MAAGTIVLFLPRGHVRTRYTVALEEAGYRVLAAGDASELRAISARHIADIVFVGGLLEHRAPRRAWLALKRMLHHARPLMIGVAPKASDIPRLVDRGVNADGYTRERVMQAVLQSHVRAWMRLRRTEQAYRASSRQRTDLCRRLLVAEERERQRLATELHDRLGSALTALSLNLAVLGQYTFASDARVKQRLHDCDRLLEELSLSMRDVLAELRPAALERREFGTAVDEHAAQFSRRTGLGVHVRGKPRHPVPELTAIAAFRILEEALNNIAKHAQAQTVQIGLQTTARQLRVEVADDGIGFDALERAEHRAGRGMSTMQERAAAAGGVVQWKRRRPKGTRVQIALPLEEAVQKT